MKVFLGKSKQWAAELDNYIYDFENKYFQTFIKIHKILKLLYPQTLVILW